MNKELLKEFIEKDIGNPADDILLNKFELYYKLLKKWNSRFNLTAIKDENDVLIKHFIDSLYPLKFIKFCKDDKIVDIGSGAGFPAIPLAILNPNSKFTLVESNNKKVSFLNELIKELNLENVEIIAQRVESLKEFKEQFDYGTARAVSQLNMLIELIVPLLKINGQFLAYKGSMVDIEIKQSKRAMHILNAEIINKFEYNLPILNDGRSLLVIRKRKASDPKYPRSYSLIKNKPL